MYQTKVKRLSKKQQDAYILQEYITRFGLRKVPRTKLDLYRMVEQEQAAGVRSAWKESANKATTATEQAFSMHDIRQGQAEVIAAASLMAKANASLTFSLGKLLDPSKKGW